MHTACRSNKVGWTIRGKACPPQSGVGSGEKSYGAPFPEKNGIFRLTWRLLAHFKRAGVEIALINSLQFWCVHTVTNRFYYRNCLTCTAI